MLGNLFVDGVFNLQIFSNRFNHPIHFTETFKVFLVSAPLNEVHILWVIKWSRFKLGEILSSLRYQFFIQIIQKNRNASVGHMASQLSTHGSGPQYSHFFYCY